MTKLAPLAAVAAAVTTVAAPLVARADGYDNDSPPGMTAPLTAPAASTTASTEAPKSENTALMLSLGGTAASAALVIAGGQLDNGGMIGAGLLSSLLTPSLGEWYAGELVTPGMGIRAASAVATIVGMAESLKCLDAEGDCHTDASAPVLLVGGLIGYAGGTVYDIATAPREAQRYNARHGLRLTLAPTPLRTPTGQATMGVGIGGTF
ncbi:MAG: hypothetical protein JO257_22370 [Deltaproteobacteria bacterium]|nr:hypothetical protein [Deltaproteobacteria bacterium]